MKKWIIGFWIFSIVSLAGAGLQMDLTCSVEKLLKIFNLSHFRLAPSGLFLYTIENEHDIEISKKGGEGSLSDRQIYAALL